MRTATTTVVNAAASPAPAKNAAPKVLANLTTQQAAALTPKPASETAAAAIATAFREAFDGIVDSSRDIDAAKDGVTQATEAGDGVRERVLVRTAKASREAEWTADQINSVKRADLIADWSKGRNYTPKSIGQFATEVAQAMHPSARDHVESALTLSRTMWEQEREAAAAARKAGTTPDETLKNAFKKRYHMVAGSSGILASHIKADMVDKHGKPVHPHMTHEIAADPHELASVNAGVAQNSAKRAASVVNRTLETLNELAKDFPEPNLQAAIKSLANATTERLASARNMLVREQAPRAPMPTTPAPKPTKAPATTSAPSADQVAEASDALLALLADPAILAKLLRK